MVLDFCRKIEAILGIRDGATAKLKSFQNLTNNVHFIQFRINGILKNEIIIIL